MTFPYKIIDLSHTLTAQIPVWDLSCGFQLTNVLSYNDCDTEVKFKVQNIAAPAGIGTHIDAPAHCIPNAASVSDLDIEKNHLVTDCIVIDVSKKADEHYQIGLDDVLRFENLYGVIPVNCFVIFYTGWDRHWPSEFYRNDLKFPSIHPEVAEFVIKRQVAGIGIDTLSPDIPSSHFPVHQTMLSNGKFIVENIANASKLPSVGATILILPVKIHEATEAPVRAIGLIPLLDV